MNCSNNNPSGVFPAGHQIPPPPGVHTGCRSCSGDSIPVPPPEPRMRQRSETGFYRAGRQMGAAANVPPMMKDNNLSMQLAMAYVPWQQWSQTYPIDQALIRGTLFPELDFPFVMGRCR